MTRLPAIQNRWYPAKASSERASYNGSIEASQASDVGSIPIARSNKLKKLRDGLIFHIFQNYNFVANPGWKMRPGFAR